MWPLSSRFSASPPSRGIFTSRYYPPSLKGQGQNICLLPVQRARGSSYHHYPLPPPPYIRPNSSLLYMGVQCPSDTLSVDKKVMQLGSGRTHGPRGKL